MKKKNFHFKIIKKLEKKTKKKQELTPVTSPAPNNPKIGYPLTSKTSALGEIATPPIV